MKHLYLSTHLPLKKNLRLKFSYLNVPVSSWRRRSALSHENANYRSSSDYRNENLKGKREASGKLVEKYQNDLREEIKSNVTHFRKHPTSETREPHENDDRISSKVMNIMERN
jgi:hypothetical protein